MRNLYRNIAMRGFAGGGGGGDKVLDSNGKLLNSVLPVGYPYAETITYGDTLTWDGNTDGLTAVDLGERGVIYKISDATPTLAEAQRGGNLVTADETYSFTSESIMVAPDVGYAIISPSHLMVLLEDNVELFGGTFPEKGCYSMATSGISLTINGYIFETTVVKPIDPKFLPTSNVNVYACYSEMADDGRIQRSVSLNPEFISGYAPESYMATMQELLSANTFTMYEGQTEVGVPAHLTYHEANDNNPNGYVTLTFWSKHDGAVRVLYNKEYTR